MPVRGDFLRQSNWGLPIMGWRSKLITLLIVYFAGFATAIYVLGPTPQGATPARIPGTEIDSEAFVQRFNEGMHKAAATGKEIAVRAGKYMKDKMQDMDIKADG